MNTGIRTPIQTTNVAQLQTMRTRLQQVIAALSAENANLRAARMQPHSSTFIPPAGNRMIPGARRKIAYGAAFFGEKMERRLGFNY